MKLLILLKNLFFVWIDLLSVLFLATDIGAILKRQKLNAELSWLRSFQLRTLILSAILLALNVLPLTVGYVCYKQAMKAGEFKGGIVKTLIKKKGLPQSIKSASRSLSTALGICIAANILVSIMHPVLAQTRKLKKLTLDEKNPNLARCWLPIGVYMDTLGQDSKNIVQDERIWAAMNMVVDKDMIYESPKNRTKKLFVSSFELLDQYNYDIPIHKTV